MEKTRPRAQVALLPKRSSKNAREAIPAHDGCKMTFAFPMSVSSHVPSAMHFECLVLDYQLYDDHRRAKKSSHSTSCSWTCWAPPSAKWEVAHRGSPSRRQSNFLLILFEFRVRSHRGTTSLSFSIGGRARVPVKCEDFFARR